MKKKIKVVYIAGYGRSGTTLLNNVLGEVKGLFSVGELRHIWKYCLLDNYYCGCKKRFNRCLFWKKVFNKMPEINRTRIVSLANDFHPFSLVMIKVLTTTKIKKYKKMTDLIGRLYKTISQISGEKIIVSSSKSPGKLRLIMASTLHNSYLIHLVRDPRAVAFSWKKRKKAEPFKDSRAFLPRHIPLYTACEWLLWNVIVEVFKRLTKKHAFFLRYEDFCSKPYKSTGALIHFIGERKENPIKGKTINFKTNHNIVGNPVKFLRGRVKIKCDDEWLNKMPFWDKLLVTVITFPLLVYYRYPILKGFVRD